MACIRAPPLPLGNRALFDYRVPGNVTLEQPFVFTAPEDLAAEMQAIEAELARRDYLEDPVRWSRERLGDTLWTGQQTIMRTIATNRRTAVKSCHEVGKSYIAASVVGWWLDVHAPGDAFVVTSAPTAAQVRAILWREIGRVHTRGKLRGRLNQTEWHLDMPGGKEELIAFGRKPDDYDPAAFQGIHAPYVLIVMDEACGIPASLYEAADSLIANDNSKALAIGNPDDPTTEFFQICKPGSGWNVISIGAFDSPNFTGEPMPERVLQQLIGRTYVEEKRRKWAPSWTWTPDGRRIEPPENAKREESANPLWFSKVLGEFPTNAEAGGLLPISWVRAAQERTLSATGASELGVDVGGGGDSSTGCHRVGPVYRIKWEDKNPDTMQTCGQAIAVLRETGASIAKVDEIGIGRGVVDRAKELGQPFLGVNVGEGADDPEAYVNRRAELWWRVRERFERGDIDIDPLDEDLAAELVSIHYKRTSAGKIQIESKDEAKRRGVASPNRADALMLADAMPKYAPSSATWGR